MGCANNNYGDCSPSRHRRCWSEIPVISHRKKNAFVEWYNPIERKKLRIGKGANNCRIEHINRNSLSMLVSCYSWYMVSSHGSSDPWVENGDNPQSPDVGVHQLRFLQVPWVLDWITIWLMVIDGDLPSGKHTKNMENQHSWLVNQRTKWPCSMAV